MPNPIEVLLDPVSLVVIALYAALFLWESLFPGRVLPAIKGWKLRGISMFFLFFYLSTYLPLLWDNYLAQFQLIDLSRLPVAVQALLGVLTYELGVYVWHRMLHTHDVLWKVFHQMHHSAERLDIPGAFYFSPLDMVGWIGLGSLCFALGMGLSPEATTLVLLTTTFLGMFQHANIRTPVWLGYIVQRPESHTVHHARGVHAYNYSDLPVFDMLFGTFKNPHAFEHETGFYDGASARVGDMLTFKDVSREPEANKTLENA